MAESREVLIDGVRYVPATELVHGTLVDRVLQALYEQYAGADRGTWRDGDYAGQDLRIFVTDDPEDRGDTFEEFAARIAQLP